MSDQETPEAFESHRRENTPAPDAERPDWLVGAEEGAQAESERSGQPAPHLKLVAPAADAAPAQGAAKQPARPQAWKAAASSVPKLQRVEGTGLFEAPSALRARAAEPMWAEPGFGAAGGPDAPDLDDFPGRGEPGDAAEADGPLAVPRAPAPAASRGSVLDEPWWAIAIDMLQTHRPLQLGILAVVLAMVAFLAWPRSQPTVSIRSIHDHPERYDGVTVRVHGRVGDVYEIGGAYAFYLEQGRDTIVVFSRARRPYRNEKLHVSGSVSMGYLDGVARPSLFEIPE